MTGSELRLLLAYDLRWFAPEDAKRVVARAVELGLLASDGEQLRPSFDAGAVDIPLNFRPGLHVLDETARTPPAPRSAPTEVERAAEDERRKRGLMISIEVARLVVRRRAGDEVAEEAAAMEARLLNADVPARSGPP